MDSIRTSLLFLGNNANKLNIETYKRFNYTLFQCNQKAKKKIKYPKYVNNLTTYNKEEKKFRYHSLFNNLSKNIVNYKASLIKNSLPKKNIIISPKIENISLIPKRKKLNLEIKISKPDYLNILKTRNLFNTDLSFPKLKDKFPKSKDKIYSKSHNIIRKAKPHHIEHNEQSKKSPNDFVLNIFRVISDTKNIANRTLRSFNTQMLKNHYLMKKFFLVKKNILTNIKMNSFKTNSPKHNSKI